MFDHIQKIDQPISSEEIVCRLEKTSSLPIFKLREKVLKCVDRCYVDETLVISAPSEEIKQEEGALTPVYKRGKEIKQKTITFD